MEKDLKELLEVIEEAKTLKAVKSYVAINFKYMPLFLNIIEKEDPTEFVKYYFGETVNRGYGVHLRNNMVGTTLESLKIPLTYALNIGTGVHYEKIDEKTFHFKPILLIEDKDEAFLTAGQNDQPYIIDLKTYKKIKVTMRD